jgi:hypothetical protein
LKVDYGVAREQNLAMQSHNWYVGSGTDKTGTIFEAGMMKAADKLKSYDGLYTDEFVK